MGTLFAPAEQLMINDYIIKTSPDEYDLYGAKRERGGTTKKTKKSCARWTTNSRIKMYYCIMGVIITVNRNNNATFQYLI